ncbi:MAG: DUF1207 domain-containing protein [Bacteroidota bacterium]|nr:DUF1207 domain-containing protein [Bacteroidota bacterium]
MKTPVTLLLCILAVTPPVFSQSIPLVDSRLLFPPLIAHHLEPRVGMSRLVEEERLRLDIGNSIDVQRWEDGLDGMTVAAGVDFFTWTSLRQEKDFHFPVDAVDYLFGLYASVRRDITDESSVSARLRLSHISAHLVDGSYLKEEQRWRDGQLPRVYSREFIDLVVAFEYRDWLRAYGGGKYVYHVDPPGLGRWTPQAGLEAAWLRVLDAPLHAYLAVDARMLDVNGWDAAVNVQAGVKVGAWRGTGVDLFVAYYHGMSQHGEYYDMMWSYWGPGINFAF